MKQKYSFSTIVVIGALFITSCEGFLETESNSTFTEDNVFSNIDFAQKAVYGIYDNLANSHTYDYTLSYFFPCDNDIEHVAGDLADDSGRRSLARYKGNDGYSQLASTWRTLYQTIERANICIDNLPLSPIWTGEYESDAKRLYAEAKVLRALCYYDLIKNWGDVPFSMKSLQDGDNFFQPKTDRDEIYEFLIEDLKEAEQFLPWITETGTAERVNRGFSKGLRARMALSYAGYSLRNKVLETRRGRNWEEYYQIARTECLEIMESEKHMLNPDYKGIFKTIHAYGQDPNGEILFEIAFGRLYSGRVAQSIGMPHTVAPADPKYGRAAGEIFTNPYYFYSFDKADLRRNVSCEFYNYASSTKSGVQALLTTPYSFRVCKWRRSWIVPNMGGALKESNYTGINWPLMRYSDVVLMFAEAENELNGPTQAARNALASVRQRAFTSDLWATKVTAYVDSVATSKEDFFNAIVDERAWEFGGEMIRKYDLVRWNLLGAKVKEAREENIAIINNAPKWSYIPNYLFYKYLPDNETIDILNQDYRLPSTAISGYTRASWMSGISASQKTRFIDAMNNIASGFDETKNNHLFPLAATIITESKGTLSNDQIP